MAADPSLDAVRPTIDVRSLVKDTLLTGFVTLALALPLAGVRLVDQAGRLGAEPRPLLVVALVAAAMIGRLAWLLWRARHRPVAASADEGFETLRALVSPHMKSIVLAALVFALVLPLLPFSSRRTVDLASLVMIYMMLGWGLNIVVGLAGLLDLGYVAFYAVGAYSYTLLALNFGLSFWECLPLAGAFAAFFGILLGFPVLRLRGDYLAIVTLGFGEMVHIILINWSSLTGGSRGITSIPSPTLFGLQFTQTPRDGVTAFHEFFGIPFSGMHRLIFLYYLILVLALLTNFFTLRIRRLPIGRAWEALREDEIACRALGLNPTMIKLSAFGLGAMFAGFAGAFFATRQGFINPSSFTFIESAIILAIVVLGGMGSQLGVAVAATILVLLPELTREFAQFRLLFFGAAMVGIMIWRPQGLLAHRDPTVRLGGQGPPEKFVERAS
jgi:branched-chain amino acid transport system permease protein